MRRDLVVHGLINSGRLKVVENALIVDGKPVRTYTSPKGYVGTCLPGLRGKYGGHYFVHRALALAWLGVPEWPRVQVNHINGIKSDNRRENIEWVTASGNAVHAWGTGLQKVGTSQTRFRLENPNQTLNEIHVVGIRAASQAGFSAGRIAAAYGVGRSTVNDILNGKTWRKDGGAP